MMDEAIYETDRYALIIYGVPLDFFPAAACRRAKGFADVPLKIIKCPYCGKQLTSIDASIKVELYRYPKKKKISCHEYRKCGSCGEMVGIIFVREEAGI